MKNNKILLLMLLPNFLFSAGGLSKVNTLLETISGWLYGAAAVTVTIAILWVGYKILFGGQTLRECAPVLIGSIIIASASTIAGLLIS